MKVVEKFVSINGESTKAGEPAVFIRFKGCNLNCSYCDTKWANEPDCPYEEMSPEEIVQYVKEAKINNVTLTGGEPLLQKDIGTLIDILREEDLNVEIETNGSVDISKIKVKNRPVFTLDYKSPSSGCEEKMFMENFQQLVKEDAVKFVVGNRQDLVQAKKVIDTYQLVDTCHVYFSPVFGSIEPEEIVNYLLENKMNGVRLQLQLHKFIWNPDKRGV